MIHNSSSPLDADIESYFLPNSTAASNYYAHRAEMVAQDLYDVFNSFGFVLPLNTACTLNYLINEILKIYSTNNIKTVYAITLLSMYNNDFPSGIYKSYTGRIIFITKNSNQTSTKQLHIL